MYLFHLLKSPISLNEVMQSEDGKILFPTVCVLRLICFILVFSLSLDHQETRQCYFIFLPPPLHSLQVSYFIPFSRKYYHKLLIES